MKVDISLLLACVALVTAVLTYVLIVRPMNARDRALEMTKRHRQLMLDMVVLQTTEPSELSNRISLLKKMTLVSFADHIDAIVRGGDPLDLYDEEVSTFLRKMGWDQVA